MQPLVMPVMLGIHEITEVREQFRYPYDNYSGWAVLAPVTSRIEFTLEPAEGSSVSGICQMGSLIICPPQVVLHRRRPEPSRTWFAEFSLTDPDLAPWWPSGLVSVSDRSRLRSNYDILDRSGQLTLSSRRHQHAHVLMDVLLLVGRENQPTNEPRDEAATAGATLLSERFGDADLTIGEVAAQVHLSRTQFTRRFTQAYGVPPIRYLTEIRLGRASRLLLDTDLPVAVIAEACGYRSAFYFARVFRQFTDTSPTTYRATRRI